MLPPAAFAHLLLLHLPISSIAGQNVQVFVGKRPCLDSVPPPPLPIVVIARRPRVHAPTAGLDIPSPAPLLRPSCRRRHRRFGSSSRRSRAFNVNSSSSPSPCRIFMMTHPSRLFCRRVSHAAKRHRLRGAPRHFCCPQELSHVRRLLRHSSRPPLRPRRHYRQARALIAIHPLCACPDPRNCSIKVGGTSCERNMWFSDSSILCKVPLACPRNSPRAHA